MYTLFISDLHLSPSNKQLLELYVNFINHIPSNCDALYILGDLFDYWAGEDINSDFINQVMHPIKELHNRNIKTYFMAGNRDFLISQSFLHKYHCTLLPDPYYIDLYKTKTILTHGDTLGDPNYGYDFYRKFAHIKFMQKLFLSLPKFIRKFIAGNVRSYSKQKKHKNANIKNEINNKKIIQLLQQYQAQQMIHGHIHKAGIHTHNDNTNKYTRIVLGDWGNKGHVIIYNTDNTYDLKHFSIEDINAIL